MGKVRAHQHAFNIGVQDKTALTRIDLERMRLAAEEQTNFMAKATGPGFMRPGLEYLGTTYDEDNITRLKEFVFGATDAALMEFSSEILRVRVDDEIITRPAVTAAVTSGTFAASTGWTLTATDGATSTVGSGHLNLTAAARGSLASATQTVAVNEANVEHALRIVITRGPVTFRCGSSSGGDEYIPETDLRTGTHSLSFTPTGANFYIEFKSSLPVLKLVDSITVEAAGEMTLPTPWTAGILDSMRFAQSADVVFVAGDGVQQRRIERRNATSWSVVLYRTNDGPFTADRTRQVKLKSSVTEGNGTLTASASFFSSSHVGALFRLTNSGVVQTFKLAGESTFSDPIRVTGVNGAGSATGYNDRDWSYSVTGTWVGTLNWRRSFDSIDAGYSVFRKATGSSAIDITGNVGSTANEDDSDNAIVFYKLGFDVGDYTSGEATVTVTYDGGSGAGICRVVAYTSPTVVDIEVLTPFKSTEYTDNWQEGEWSASQTWPSAVAFSDGRLWWSGSDRLWGSISDAFESFDDEMEGDAAPISRSIATGGVNDTQWLLALQRLIIGTEGAAAVAKSSSLDEPLTPTNLTIKDSSTVGAGAVDPVKVDSRGLFVDRAGSALFELTFDAGAGEYIATQMSKLTTDVFSSGVKTVAIQRRPDTRIWLVMDDGTCVCCLYEPDQEVLAFIPIETDGDFESVAVLPSSSQDRVYFVVARTIDGSTVRYVEKMALDSEVKPSTLCKVMDAFVTGTAASATTTLAVGTHLAGETVVVWVNGAPIETSSGVRGEYLVSSAGNITLGSAVTGQWVAGLPYRMRYKSARLAYGASGGTALLQKKSIPTIGLIMTDFVRAGVKIGQSFDKMYPLPLKTNGSTADAIVLSDVNDEDPITFGGSWSTDARVHIECNSPYTMTALGMVLEVETNG